MRTAIITAAAAIVMLGAGSASACGSEDNCRMSGGWGSDIGAQHGTPGYSDRGQPHQRAPSINRLAREVGKTLDAGARRAVEIATIDNRPRNSQGALGPGNQPGRSTGDPGGNVNRGNVNAGR
jgi:hypothetical protein